MLIVCCAGKPKRMLRETLCRDCLFMLELKRTLFLKGRATRMRLEGYFPNKYIGFVCMVSTYCDPVRHNVDLSSSFPFSIHACQYFPRHRSDKKADTTKRQLNC